MSGLEIQSIILFKIFLTEVLSSKIGLIQAQLDHMIEL